MSALIGAIETEGEKCRAMVKIKEAKQWPRRRERERERERQRETE